MSITNREDFIAQEILPILGDYADDFDIDSIADEVSEYSPDLGYIWKMDYLMYDHMLESVLFRNDRTIHPKKA